MVYPYAVPPRPWVGSTLLASAREALNGLVRCIPSQANVDMAAVPYYVRALFDFFEADWTVAGRAAETGARYPASVLRACVAGGRTPALLARVQALAAQCPIHRFEADSRSTTDDRVVTAPAASICALALLACASSAHAHLTLSAGSSSWPAALDVDLGRRQSVVRPGSATEGTQGDWLPHALDGGASETAINVKGSMGP
jgi:hypothetical protein